MSHLRHVPALVLPCLLALALSACGGASEGEDEREPRSTPAEKTPALEIVPGAGITGVTIGDSRELVVQHLGEPTGTSRVPNEFSGGENERLEYDDPMVTLLVQEFDGGTELLQVEVTDPDLRTSTGDISIGSTQEQLLDAFPAASCDTGALHLCRLGRERAGEIVTDFFVQDGEVSRIVVGRIID